MSKKISDLPHKNLNQYDIESIMSLKENGYSIKKEWQDELNEAVTVIHQRTEAIARLWKYFKLSIDDIESILDFFGGDVSMAFEYLNSQERYSHRYIKQFDPAIVGTTAIPFAPCNNNLPDPLPVNNQCLGELKYKCSQCDKMVSKLYGVGRGSAMCLDCLPF